MKLIWLIVAILFAVAELMTTTLTLIWFSIGAVILIFLSSIIDSILIQIIIFAIISTLMLTIATKKFIKQDKDYKYKTIKKNDNTNSNKSSNIFNNICNSKQQLHILRRIFKKSK